MKTRSGEPPVVLGAPARGIEFRDDLVRFHYSQVGGSLPIGCLID